MHCNLKLLWPWTLNKQRKWGNYLQNWARPNKFIEINVFVIVNASKQKTFLRWDLGHYGQHRRYVPYHPYQEAYELVGKRVGHWTIPRAVATPIPDSQSVNPYIVMDIGSPIPLNWINWMMKYMIIWLSNELKLQKFFVWKILAVKKSRKLNSGEPVSNFRVFKLFPLLLKTHFIPIFINGAVVLSELSKTCAQNPYHRCQYFQLWHRFLDPGDIFVISLILAISY